MRASKEALSLLLLLHPHTTHSFTLPSLTTHTHTTPFLPRNHHHTPLHASSSTVTDED
eukprot:CAMPEP_0198270692 /NCGR_PEP_ID=MMETSP1447-20131203/46036_1 /TAXON_ID=420782 /ORGANISM="Chaetoceros dichaeta, Strain CCMP1751" /LENGTH=57 /DNA_ID=CAMNT_0043962837 /DNA_START=55 /DNA_END=225 /DNA_ORIENTATION=-